MRILWVILFLIYTGCLLLLAGAMMEWVEQPELILQEVEWSYWGYIIKRISVAVIAVAGIAITFFYTGRTYFHMNMKRRYIFLQMVMAAVALFIIISGAIPQEQQAYLDNTTGYTITLLGGIAFLLGCIANYFYIKRTQARGET